MFNWSKTQNILEILFYITLYEKQNLMINDIVPVKFFRLYINPFLLTMEQLKINFCNNRWQHSGSIHFAFTLLLFISYVKHF